ncbi:MAG: alpha/beta fold hydrolase [Thermoleophilaceae bacterium]
MNEQFAHANGIELCYETFGDRSDPALLLIMGLGTQMVAWREDFCRALADRGFFVIRYDNRDCGRSTKMKGKPVSLIELTTRRPRDLPYTLDDMADDAVGLLDELGIDRAHVVGASMGGMIAQHVGFSHPDRVLSLVSIMASTGHRLVGQPRLTVIPLFLSRPTGGKQEYLDRAVKLFRAVGSTKFFDEEGVREIAALGWERGIDMAGTGRQLGAITADGNRTKRLGRITAPTLVIHGTDDKLVSPSGGRATARAIPGARLMMVEGMGHDLPRPLWPKLIDAIVENTTRAADPNPRVSTTYP